MRFQAQLSLQNALAVLGEHAAVLRITEMEVQRLEDENVRLTSERETIAFEMNERDRTIQFLNARIDAIKAGQVDPADFLPEGERLADGTEA